MQRNTPLRRTRTAAAGQNLGNGIIAEKSERARLQARTSSKSTGREESVDNEDADAPIFRVQHIQVAPTGTGRERHVEQSRCGNRAACPIDVVVTRSARES